MSLVKGKPPISGATGDGGVSVGGGNSAVGGTGSGNSTATPNGGASRKKSILKKSEISVKGPKPSTGSSTADPELENLLVSDQETSANSTPAISRKKPNSQLPVSNPVPIVELPPTANNEQLKSLTGPKLRKAGAPLPPGVGNRNQQIQKNGGSQQQQQNKSKNNGKFNKIYSGVSKY